MRRPKLRPRLIGSGQPDPLRDLLLARHVGQDAVGRRSAIHLGPLAQGERSSATAVAIGEGAQPAGPAHGLDRREATRPSNVGLRPNELPAVDDAGGLVLGAGPVGGAGEWVGYGAR